MELNQSKLITLSSIRGEYSVTSRGQSVLEENPNKINREYLKRFPEYLEFLERSKNKSKKSSLKSNVFKDIQEIESDDQIPKTQKKVYQDARLGQGKFRRNLLKLWRGCSVTGYANKELLIASHIKPWKFSNPYERLDKYNGLLLMPNLDKLFDSGLISFEDNGRIIISNRLSHNDLNKLNIKESMLVELKNENIKYIRFHRSSIFS